MRMMMVGPATKPANCGEERTLLPSKAGDFAKFVPDLVGGVWTSLLSKHGNKIEEISIKEVRFQLFIPKKYVKD